MCKPKTPENVLWMPPIPIDSKGFAIIYPADIPAVGQLDFLVEEVMGAIRNLSSHQAYDKDVEGKLRRALRHIGIDPVTGNPLDDSDET
jgi:hypothetical protein